MFRELFTEGKKGATNGIEWKIEDYFKAKGYTAGILINYHNDNEIKVQVYKLASDDEEGTDENQVADFVMPYNKISPSKLYKEFLKRKTSV